jgi:hypothetical protein
MREIPYQAELSETIEERFPGSFVIKQDPSRIQGIPDLLVLFGPKWALLEVKRSRTASRRPNQPYYTDKFNKMGFAAFIYPENEEEVLDAMARYFGLV